MSTKALYAEAISQEAISYQGGKSMLLHDLTAAYQNYIASGQWNQRGMDENKFSQIVRKHTGLNIEFKVAPGVVNAWAMPPIIDVNSPLMDRFRDMGFNDAEDYADVHLTFKKVTAFSKELHGSVDRANGRVSGVFSKLLVQVTIGSGMWDVAKCTAEEVAAITLHELGHVYTFIECLMQSATTNMVLSSANQALAKTTEMNHRLQLVFETEQAMGVKLEDRESIARHDVKASTFNAVFLKAAMDPKLHSTNGSSTYDLRSSEFLADQFAARYGAGVHAVTGLDKMHRAMGGTHRISTPAWFAIQGGLAIITALSLVAAPAQVIIIAVLMLAFSNPEAKIYDDPAERFTRIRQDLVQSLKDLTLPKAVREKLLEDIQTIDKVREGVKDHRGLFTYLWLACSSKRRDQYSQMRFQQEIERLVNNEFFVKAQQFQTLA